jgi:rhodanese-related sulfurtransferase
VATGIVLLAIVAVRLARLSTPAVARPAWWRLSTVEAVGLTLAIAYAAADPRAGTTSARLASVAAAIVREEDHVDAVELAGWIQAGRTDLRILDVREAVDTGDYVIPGAEVVPIERLAELEVGAGEFVVLYSEGGAHAAQAWVLLRMRGLVDARVLKDGMAAWEDEVMAPTIVPGLTGADAARQERQRELSIWFGGTPRTSGTPSIVPLGGSTAGTPVRRRRNTC